MVWKGSEISDFSQIVSPRKFLLQGKEYKACLHDIGQGGEQNSE